MDNTRTFRTDTTQCSIQYDTRERFMTKETPGVQQHCDSAGRGSILYISTSTCLDESFPQQSLLGMAVPSTGAESGKIIQLRQIQTNLFGGVAHHTSTSVTGDLDWSEKPRKGHSCTPSLQALLLQRRPAPRNLILGLCHAAEFVETDGVVPWPEVGDPSSAVCSHFAF